MLVSNCSIESTEKMMLFITTAMLFGTSSLAATTRKPTVSTVSTTHPTKIYESAIFFCGDFVYQDDLAMLFPPSDVVLPNIVNATLAQTVHRQSFMDFCSKLDTYIYCVNELVTRKFSKIDDRIKDYVDFGKLSTALYAFCRANDSIPAQFMCTKEQVEKHSCPNGGMYGIITYVDYAIKVGVARETYCSELQRSIRCRVDEQLKKCGDKYAVLMEFVYTELAKKFCLTLWDKRI